LNNFPKIYNIAVTIYMATVNDKSNSFWWARAGTTQIRVLENLLSACLHLDGNCDPSIVDLYSHIRRDHFASLVDLAETPRRAEFQRVLEKALLILAEKEDWEETVYHARGTLQVLAELIDS
jgi:hypothetical protein